MNFSFTFYIWIWSPRIINFHKNSPTFDIFSELELRIATKFNKKQYLFNNVHIFVAVAIIIAKIISTFTLIKANVNYSFKDIFIYLSFLNCLGLDALVKWHNP